MLSCSAGDHKWPTSNISILVWDALTAILVTDRNSDKGTVAAHLINAPKAHVMAAQFILLGSGFATEDCRPPERMTDRQMRACISYGRFDIAEPIRRRHYPRGSVAVFIFKIKIEDCLRGPEGSLRYISILKFPKFSL